MLPEEGESSETITRRRFLARLSIGLSVFGAAVIGLPVVSFLLEPVFRKSPREWRKVGGVEAFKIGTTVEVKFEDPDPLPWVGKLGKSAAYLRRVDETQFIAFAVNCTHLGCPVRWLPDARLFMCPCHGGVFYEDGQVAAGPPPKALTQYQVRIHEGDVEIKTSPIPIG